LATHAALKTSSGVPFYIMQRHNILYIFDTG